MGIKSEEINRSINHSVGTFRHHPRVVICPLSSSWVAWVDLWSTANARQSSTLLHLPRSIAPKDITWRSAAREDWGRPEAAAAVATAAAAGFGPRDGVLVEEGKVRRQQCPELKVVRTWGRSSSRRLTFYAPYWIVNKTGLALNYRAR